MNPENVKTWLVLVLATVFSSPVSAAVVQGAVYEWSSFDYLVNAVVEVNTTPKQVMVAKNAFYRFELPPGDYAIHASFYKNELLALEDVESVSVRNASGTYVLDLMLFPAEGFEGELLNETDSDTNGLVEEPPVEAQEPLVYALVVSALVLVVALYFFLKQRAPREVEKTVSHVKKISKKMRLPKQLPALPEIPKLLPQEAELDEEAREALKKIRENEGRITQKELRKQLPYSEAKASLIVSELEARGLVKKFKKGRGNIIVLQK